MFICRLFHSDRPFEQVEARLIAEGRVTIGRDPSADWPMTDSASTLSRLHCVLAVEEGRLVLYDKSTNGVFLAGGARAPLDTPTPLAHGDSLRLGSLCITVEAPAEVAVDTGATTILAPGWSGPTPVAATWAEGADVAEPPSPAAHRDISLVEAFCEGARLDSSALSSEDPAELMRRVGAIYQQTVLGLAALMNDRAQVKQTHAMEHTVIAARDNNPFKWASSRQLAEDLLCGRQDAFLSDAAAVRACFEDLSHHMAGLVGGAQAAVARAASELDPAAIDTAARAQATLLRSRGALMADILAERHAALFAAEGGRGAPLQKAFAAGYARGRADDRAA